MKDVYKNCLAIVLVETISIFGVLGIAKTAVDIADHVKKQSLEKYVDKEIQRPIVDDDTKRRQERIVRFKDIQRKVKNSWDYADRQLPLFDVVSFYEEPASNIEAQTIHRGRFPTLELAINFANMQPRLEAVGLVHEMAHAWCSALKEKKEFENKWSEIAGDGYTHNTKFELQECLTSMRNVAAVSCYGATNIAEDVATTVGKVYELKTEPNFMTEEASRIQEKIRLAAAYNFFSERERDNALGKIIKVYPVQIAGSEK